MGYATKQDLIDRFGQPELIELTDRATPPTGVIDDVVITRALADADAQIEAYISITHTLPLSPIPATLVRMAGDIARYYLYEDRATEQVKERFEAAIAFLKNVAAGKAGLGVDAGGSAPAPAATVQFPKSQKVFAREDID